MKKLFYLVLLCALVFVSCVSNAGHEVATSVVDAAEVIGDTITNGLDSLVIDSI